MGKLKFKALFIVLAAVLGVAASSALFWEKTSDVNNTFKLSKTESGISITYDANGGSFNNKASTNTVIYDKKDFSILSGEEKTPTRTYYAFKGWYLDKTCTDGQELDLTTGKYANTVYAKWAEDTITINYDANGGKFDNGETTNAVVYKQGTKLTLLSGEVKTPTRAGYDFDGWYYAKTGSGDKFNVSNVSSSRLNYLKGYPYVFAKWTRMPVIDAAKLTALIKDNSYAITSIGYSSRTSGTNIAPDGEDAVYARVEYGKLYLSATEAFISGDAGGMFNGCRNLSNINFLSYWDVSGVTNMNSMFSDCSKISNISSLKSWNVANVTDMGSMFLNCTGLSDISSLESWNVSRVTNLVNTFKGCSSLTDASKLSNWQVSLSSCDVTDAFTDSGITNNSLYPKWYIAPSAAKLNLWSEGDWSLD